MANPRVFISYAHESPEHRAAVKGLADWLLERGIEVLTDHPYEIRPPELGWQAWMQHSLEDADAVLVVCTPRLKARYEKREEAGTGLGATFEGAIVTQAMYDAAQRNTKFFPVLPDGGDRNNIPTTLRPFDNGHRFPSGNERILRLITEEVRVPKPKRPFDRLPPGQLRGAHDNRLEPREGQVYGRDSEVERVLEFLRSVDGGAVVCAQVTGTAGIGKTEVCKAALRRWLAESAPESDPRRAFYIEIPDSAGADQLVFRIGRALGGENIATFEELQPLLREGLYYLDNLESVAEKVEGQAVLRQLRQQPGLRLLASSRVSLPGELGRRIEIEALELAPALQLFRDLWTGTQAPADEELRRFVEDDLGRHALSVTLTARLGDSYAFGVLVQRWKAKGTALAANVLDGSTRQGSLAVSLALTAESLRAQPGALLLWTLAALFPLGIDEDSLSAFEQAAGLPESARQLLSRHHVWTGSGGRFRLLPPLARYALAEATNERGGFSWNEARAPGFGYFTAMAAQADSVASTDASLAARGQLLDRFGALVQLLQTEAELASPKVDLLDGLHHHLQNLYQFRAAQSRELLLALLPKLGRPASAAQALGDLERRLGRPDEARRLFERALQLYEREQAGLGQANTLQSLGDLERSRRNTVAALSTYEAALALYATEQEPMGTAYTSAEVARCQHEQGNTAAVNQALTAALAAARAAGVESVLQYVQDVLVEVNGSPEAAQECDSTVAPQRGKGKSR